MARTDNPQQLIIEQAGRWLFIKQVAFTSTGAVFDLGIGGTTNSVSGSVPIPPGARLGFMPSQSCFFQLLPAGAVSSVTNASGAQPGRSLGAVGAIEIYPELTDRQVDVVRTSADGVLNIFMVV